jgi:hypothetical protein
MIAGNVMGDAMVDYYHQNESAHKDLQIAILNGGSIRASMEEGGLVYINYSIGRGLTRISSTCNVLFRGKNEPLVNTKSKANAKHSAPV